MGQPGLAEVSKIYSGFSEITFHICFIHLVAMCVSSIFTPRALLVEGLDANIVVIILKGIIFYK